MIPLSKIMRICFLLAVILWSLEAFSQKDTLPEKEKRPYFYMEEAPSFPGGNKVSQHYFVTNLNYTEKAYNENICGTVYVRFCVTKTGKIKNPEILKGIHPDLDSIALDAVRNMPDWVPGKRGGKPVDVNFNLSFKFQLNKTGVQLTTPEPSKYWEIRGKEKFMKICREEYRKSQQECEFWYGFIISNYNNKRLKDIDLNWLFKNK